MSRGLEAQALAERGDPADPEALEAAEAAFRSGGKASLGGEDSAFAEVKTGFSRRAERGLPMATSRARWTDAARRAAARI